MAIQLKAHGAWLGGGTGAGLAGLIVGLLQQHVAHGALSPIDVQAIYSLVGVAGAFGGAYLLPTLQKDVPGLVSKDSLDNAETIAGALRKEVADLKAASAAQAAQVALNVPAPVVVPAAPVAPETPAA